MRRTIPFLTFLAMLSLLSGWLLSKIPFLGRIGINWFYKEYKFLKVWYYGAAVVFGVLLVLFLIQAFADRKMSRASSRAVHIITFIAAICGLWLTYSDFRSDFTHRILKERFHLGAYLFWIGWMSISLFFLFAARRPVRVSKIEVERLQ